MRIALAVHTLTEYTASAALSTHSNSVRVN